MSYDKERRAGDSATEFQNNNQKDTIMAKNKQERTTIFIRDIGVIEDITMHVTDRETAEATVEKILSSAETKTPVVLWNGGESIQFVSPDIIMGPSDGFSSLNLDSIIKNEQQD